MPNEQWSQFTELTTAPAGDDFSAIVDKDDLTDATTGTTKRISWLNIIKHLFSSRFAADAGSTDTYVATLFPAPVAYETGQHYRFKANTANTGACTVNFNGLGAKTIKKAAGGITTDLVDNDIRAGQWVDLVYDGTNMQMQSLLGNAPAGGSGGIGDVVGPGSATDNALARFDTTTGKLIQGSPVTLDDDGAITVPEIAAPSTPGANKVAVYAKSDGLLYSKDDAGVETLVSGGAGGGGSTNPTSLFVPYNNAGTFADSRIKRENTNITAINGGLNNAQTFKVYLSDDGEGNANWLQFKHNGSGHEILSTGSGSGGVSNIYFKVDGASSSAVLAGGAFLPSVDRGMDLGGGGSARWNQGWFFSVIVTGGAFSINGNWVMGAYGDGDLQFTGTGSGGRMRWTMGDINGGISLQKPSGVNDYFEVKSGDSTVFRGIRSQYWKGNPVTVANLPTGVEGMMASVTDSTTATWGATITGGGSNHVLAYFNGTNWTVAAI